MDGILSQSSAHPLGERNHVGVVPLAETQAVEVLVLRVPGVALQARRNLTPVDAEDRERFESASAAAALTRPFITSPAPLARFFVLVVAAAFSLMRLCILSFVSWDIFCKCRSAGFSRLQGAAPPKREREIERERALRTRLKNIK
jgi:hypothetical protein